MDSYMTSALGLKQVRLLPPYIHTVTSISIKNYKPKSPRVLDKKIYRTELHEGKRTIATLHVTSWPVTKSPVIPYSLWLRCSYQTGSKSHPINRDKGKASQSRDMNPTSEGGGRKTNSCALLHIPPQCWLRKPTLITGQCKAAQTRKKCF